MSTEIPQQHPKKPHRKVDWGRTITAGERIKDSGEYDLPDKDAPYGRFADRPIIGSKMNRIIGGVYVGRYAREAIVVDDKGEKEGNVLLAQHYEKFREKMKKHFERIKPTGWKGLLKKIRKDTETNESKKDYLLRSVYLDVMESLPYSSKNTHQLIDHLCHGEDDRKIHLMSFILSKTGVCRHQALLAAYLIEKLMHESDPALQLDGTFSVDRNAVADIDENVHGAHVWVRYTDSEGEAWIIDAAQRKFGKLKDMLKDPKAWEYGRPDEWMQSKTA